jgi:hypothetical protein
LTKCEKTSTPSVLGKCREILMLKVFNTQTHYPKW